MNKIDEVVECLRNGGTVLLPTDTVYGLAAKPEIESAVSKIYELKERPRRLFLPVMVSSVNNLEGLGLDINQNAFRLLNSNLVPGALTIVFGFSLTNPRPDWLNNRDEVAIRIPDDAFLLEILKESGPLLVTSANRHKSQGTPNNIASILNQLNGVPDIVIDGGILQEIPSTIVNCRVSPPAIEREGCIASDRILNFLDNE